VTLRAEDENQEQAASHLKGWIQETKKRFPHPPKGGLRYACRRGAKPPKAGRR